MERIGKLLLSFLAVVCMASCSSKSEQQRLQSLILKISQDVTSRLTREFTEEAYAKEEGVAYPVPEPRRGLQEIYQECRKAVLKETDEKFPPKSREEWAQEAARKYTLYKKGDRIQVKTTIVTRPTVEGILNQIHTNALHPENDKIIIGQKWIRTADLSEQDRIAIYPDKLEKARKQYISDQTMIRMSMRKNHIRTNLKPKFHQAALDAGYLEANPGKSSDVANCLKREFWATRKSIFRQEYKAEFDRRVKKEIETTCSLLLPDLGFVLDSRSRKWRPRTLWERLSWRKPRKARPAKAKAEPESAPEPEP